MPLAEPKGEAVPVNVVPVNVVRRASSGTPPATHILAELPYLPSAVPHARQVLRESLRGAGLDEDATSVAELLVSELVTNAVKYGQPPVWLLVELRPGLIHASVSDTSTALPERRAVDDDSEGGRGLLVLDALAGSWGAVTVGSGKYLWFDLAVTPAHTPDGHASAPVPAATPRPTPAA
ncbi:ATP-binding protein [Pseudofrankia sp. BMG5.37]|uniref:ATP-binding protein n=1 Tax=Pseudofrankia sp. BMG5.37 TaxID=3050035 RepID=UPI000A650130